MVIDAKNASAAEWYEGYGALRLEDTPLTLVLSLKTVRAISKRSVSSEPWPAAGDLARGR